MSSQTRLGGLGLDLAIGRRRPSLGNQFMFHISIDSPVPNRRIMPCERTSFPSMTACHILDGRVPSLSSKKFPLGKYIDLRIRALNDPGSCSTRHAFQANKTRLNNSISRNPRPPLNFGIIMSVHATQHVFHFPSLLPHQNF